MGPPWQQVGRNINLEKNVFEPTLLSSVTQGTLMMRFLGLWHQLSSLIQRKRLRWLLTFSAYDCIFTPNPCETIVINNYPRRLKSPKGTRLSTSCYLLTQELWLKDKLRSVGRPFGLDGLDHHGRICTDQIPLSWLWKKPLPGHIASGLPGWVTKFTPFWVHTLAPLLLLLKKDLLFEWDA